MFLTGVNTLSKDQILAVGMLSSIVTTIVLVGAFLYILYIIINWVTFKKMGEPGWKSIIPILNDITKWNKVWSIKAYLIYLIQAVIIIILGNYHKTINVASTNNQPSPIVTVISIVIIVLAISMFVTFIRYERRFARAFGKSDLFVFGLIFLPLIFDMIIAFSSCEYLGNKSDTFNKKQ